MRSYFVCPECQSEVDPHESIFCDDCGVNLSKFDRLEKKTVYEECDYCPGCKVPFEFKTVSHGATDPKNPSRGQRYLKYDLRKCDKCGYEWRVNITNSSIPEERA